MAVNNSRRMNADLAEGMSDASYKKVVQDRGGVINAETYEARRDLDDAHFGIHEKQVKTLGDGTQHPSPDYVLTPSPNALRW